jgi:hypothetical protein
MLAAPRPTSLCNLGTTKYDEAIEITVRQSHLKHVQRVEATAPFL